MTKEEKIVALTIGGGAAATTALTLTSVCLAAADTGFASSTEALELKFTENSGMIWVWIGVSMGIGLLLALGIRALLFGKRQIVGGIPGGGKKKR